jgi:hypothetical protein
MKPVLFALLFPLAPVSLLAKPNVLFIAVDDLRPEIGCYGNSVVKTPNIDRIAARGILFDRAYVQQAVCSPSRTAIMTGLRPDVTKVWDLDTHFRAAQPDCITLPQHFKANGYHCAALSKIYHSGFEDGRSWNEPHWYPKGRAVDTDEVDWTKQTITKHEVNVEEYSAPMEGGEPRKNGKGPKKGPAYEVSPKEDDQLPDGATAAEAVKRLAALKARGKPFFLAVGFLKPHLPFVAPKKYWDLYDTDTIPVPAIDHLPAGSPEFAGHTNGELHAYPGVPEENPIPADFAKTLRHGYMPASVTPMPRSASCSMRSTRRASPTTPSSSSGVTTGGSSASTDSGTSTRTSRSRPGRPCSSACPDRRPPVASAKSRWSSSMSIPRSPRSAACRCRMGLVVTA